eukprot:COSAG05_NODE_192_length_14608_cov_6.266386_8_plen_340_part_00
MAATALAQKERFEKLTSAAADSAPPWAAKYIKMAAPAISSVATFAAAAWPCIHLACEKGYQVYLLTPTNLIMAAVGLVLCFFGGTYQCLFAAIEAARLSGWETTLIALQDLASEAQLILDVNEKDDKKDEDGDGKADVSTLDAKALLLHKTHLVLTKCNPDKINTALGGLWLAWIGVIATLKVQFAQTVTFSLAIADFLQKSFDNFLMAPLLSVIPKEYHKWVPICLGWACKFVAISVAWYIQAVLSAVTSGIRGGLLFARSMMDFCIGRGWDLGGLIKKDHTETYIDEAVGWTLAFLGVYFQVFVINFSVPFPLNLVMWPFGVADEYIKWAISSDTPL